MKNFIYNSIIICGLVSFMQAQTYSKETILIETHFGNMKVKLFEETPLHKTNFLKLVKEHYYDSLMFHRVIYNFMIQGGDYLSRHAGPADSLGDGDIGYTVPAEFRRSIFHKKGRLAAARDGDDVNPQLASSATQFYIVMGKVRTNEDMAKYETRINNNHYARCKQAFLKSEEGKTLSSFYQRLIAENKTDSAAAVEIAINARVMEAHRNEPEYKFDAAQIQTYTTVGGTPHLDGTYTVFGEVVEGLEVIDKIAAVKTGRRDRPLADVRMKMRLVE